MIVEAASDALHARASMHAKSCTCKTEVNEVATYRSYRGPL